MRTRSILLLAVLLSGCPAHVPVDPRIVAATWKKLDTPAYPGKQDDIVFIDPETGWYVNGAGKIQATTDGGTSWKEVASRPGTYLRAIGFLDAQHGLAGNLGPDYFPGVTDYAPLYATTDGGASWSAAADLPLPKGAGVCAIDVLQDAFINAGHLDHRTVVHVGGRVGGPAYLLRSVDAGKTWRLIDLNAQASMILDVKFFDANTGVVAAASSGEVEQSHARVLRTEDGGRTWKIVYESKRPFEITWKLSFPTREVGYVTVQNYDPEPADAQRFVARTDDGGKSWREIALVADHAQNEFGVAFATPEVGWVGATHGGFRTLDGGRTWTPVEMGTAVNKIRLLRTGKGLVGYAIGVNVFKLDAR